MGRTKRDYSIKKIVNPRTAAEQERKKKRQSFGASFLYVAGIVIGAFLVSVFGFFVMGDIARIQTIFLDGVYDSAQHESYYRTKAERMIGKHIFFSSGFTALTDEMLREKPELRSVRFVRQFPRTLRMVIDERRPQFVLERGVDTFLTDPEGFVIAAGISPHFPVIRIPTTTPMAMIGQPYSEQTIFEYTTALIESLRDVHGVEVKSVEYLRPVFVDVRVVSQKPWYLLVDTTRPVEYYARTLGTFLTEKADEEKTYTMIDLRIQDTVYWK